MNRRQQDFSHFSTRVICSRASIQPSWLNDEAVGVTHGIQDQIVAALKGANIGFQHDFWIGCATLFGSLCRLGRPQAETAYGYSCGCPSGDAVQPANHERTRMKQHRDSRGV